MNIHVDKTQQNKSQSFASSSSQFKSGDESIYQFGDNRPEAITQRKMQQIATNYSTGQKQTIQRTVYKIAGDEKEYHVTDPEKYSARTGDENVIQSLHKYKPGETIMSVATSPITIFMHGSTMNEWSAQNLFEFLEKRGYKPKPDTKIVFITCGGANLVDQFLVSKGQALSDLLGATVYLAKGVVRINDKGIPVVSKPDGDGTFEYITSEEELTRVIPKGAEGWKTYRPQEATLDMLKAEIRKARSEINEFDVLGICKWSVEWHKEILEEMTVEIRTDRRNISEHYQEAKKIRKEMRDRYAPNLNFYVELKKTITELTQIHADTTKYKEHATALKLQYEQWANSVSEGKGNLKGLRLLFQDKQIEWITPLKEQVAEEKKEQERIQTAVDEEMANKAWGFDDWDLGSLDSNEPLAQHTTSKSKKENIAEPKEDEVISMKSVKGSDSIAQRAVIDDAPVTANGKKLSEILAGLSDMDLVTNGRNLDLSLSFKTMSPYGHTILKANGIPVVASEYITKANANEHYEIVIELNKEVYHNGKNEEAMGSLIETLTHEWSLHGAQHAININSARHDLNPDLKIDHERLFSEEMTHMDFDIARQMNRKENAKHIVGIYEAYMNDVVGHISIIQDGWIDNDLRKGKKLYDELRMFGEINKVMDKHTETHEGLVEDMTDLVDWYLVDHLLGYKGLKHAEKIEIENTIELLLKILASDMSSLKGLVEMLPDFIKRSIPLLKELKEIKHARSLDDPTSARKKALAILGIKTKELDELIQISGKVDRGADFALSSKKRD